MAFFFSTSTARLFKYRKLTDDFPWMSDFYFIGGDGVYRARLQSRSDAAVYDWHSLTVASIFKAPPFLFSSFCISKLCLQGDSLQLHLFQSLPEQPRSQKVAPLIFATLFGVWAMVVSMYYLLECEGLRERWKSSKTFGKNG